MQFSEGGAEKRSTFAFWEVCRQNCSAFSFSKFLCESLEFVISSWDWGNNKSKQEILIGQRLSFRQNGTFHKFYPLFALEST